MSSTAVPHAWEALSLDWLPADSELPKVALQPGELHIARDPAMLQTILGSCVGVTFWSRRLGVGALCHGVLPGSSRQSRAASILSEGGRYVDFSIRYLARQFDALGVDRRELEVKVFGGADVLLSAVRDPSRTVGAQNRRAALEALAEEGLTALASDVGGQNGRVVHFNTRTGEVLVRRLASASALP